MWPCRSEKELAAAFPDAFRLPVNIQTAVDTCKSASATRPSKPVEKIRRPYADSAVANTELGERRLHADREQFEANRDYGFMQPLERFQPDIFLIGSITMEKDLKTSEASKTSEKPKRAEELRHSPRLGCGGMGAIQKLPACEPPCRARILNLSVGGCLMELQGPLDLAVDEIVELIFKVNQLPFRVRGNVRIVRSTVLVGFQFLQVSERTRRQLQELIEELIENLVKFQKKYLANHPAKEDTNHPKVATALKAHNAGTDHSGKISEREPNYTVNPQLYLGRWL